MISRSDDTTGEGGQANDVAEDSKHYICRTRDGWYVHAHVRPDNSMKVSSLGMSLESDKVRSAAERYDIDLKTSIFEMPYYLPETRDLHDPSKLLTRDRDTPAKKPNTHSGRW